MNTSGLFQSLRELTLQETWSIHDSMNIPKNEFISQMVCIYGTLINIKPELQINVDYTIFTKTLVSMIRKYHNHNHRRIWKTERPWPQHKFASSEAKLILPTSQIWRDHLSESCSRERTTLYPRTGWQNMNFTCHHWVRGLTHRRASYEEETMAIKLTRLFMIRHADYCLISMGAGET